MSQRTLDECAWCAEPFALETMIVGQDWKVYCSPACATAGESWSRSEQERWWNSHQPPSQASRSSGFTRLPWTSVSRK